MLCGALRINLYPAGAAPVPSRATVRKVVRGPLTEFKYERGVQPSPKLGDWVEALTEICLLYTSPSPRDS